MPILLSFVRTAILASALVISLTPCSALSFVIGPYVVFFEPGSARLGKEDRDVLDQYISAWSYYRIGGAELSGHTDRTGPARLNRRLSCARALAVRDYLIARGFPANRIGLGAFADTRPLVETAFGVAEAQNRRTEIISTGDEDFPASARRC